MTNIDTSAQPRLRIAIQKSGRLAERSLEFLKRAGLTPGFTRSKLIVPVQDMPIDLMHVRDDDIPTLVENGVCALGIVGQNVLEEHRLSAGGGERAYTEDLPLGFGRCRLKLAVPETLDYQGVISLNECRIATSYPGILTAFLQNHGVNCSMVEMSGAVEAAPRLGLADAICDLVSTGLTLTENNLKPVETIFDSQAVLVRSKAPLPEDLAELADSLIVRMHGVIATRETKYIMMNAPADKVDEITRLLPGAEAPTIMPLQGRPGHVALHAVCRESVFWETLEALKAAGGAAILVLPIEKMLP